MPEPSPTTPLLEQYEGVRARYPGHLVLFRVGDFYETFGDDARRLSKELDVVLTARGADARGERVPMAGVPYHALETYLGRLVRKGFKVAICDQVEDARQAKGLVRREVTRVVTPGTVVEDRILGGPDHNFLVSAVAAGPDVGGYAAVDVTTGEWFQGGGDGPGPEGVASALAPFDPREVVAAGATPRGSAAERFRREFPSARVEPAPDPAAPDRWPDRLRPLLAPTGPAAEAGRRLVAFLVQTQPRLLAHLAPAERGPDGRRLVLDARTLRHLEILRPMNPDDPGGATLLTCWDETSSPAGRRTLALWLANPLADVAAIEERQEAVAALLSLGADRDALRGRLARVGAPRPLATRVARPRAQPPELAALRDGLAELEPVAEGCGAAGGAGVLARVGPELRPPAPLVALLADALPDVPPPTTESGGLFRTGYAPDADRAREEERRARAELSQLEHREQAATGVKGLKVGYNQVFGYYFEVTRPNLGRVPPHFRRRQTVAAAERFVSDELEEIERRLREAREAMRLAEGTRWEEFLTQVDAHVAEIHRVARAVGVLDVLLTFAHVAEARGYVRPVVDRSRALLLRDARHPVLDRALGEKFVPNDVELDVPDRRLLVLTGPNMSGKSTYMRGVGLLIVLAQAGSYLPVRFARVGLATHLFTRMGFTDEIGRGKSSFMVEMSEVAEILRAADERSVVLLDEVGRGTSTFDGLALAWATLRHLHDRIGCRTMLATHYHQLAELVEALPSAANAHFAVRDAADGIVFLHRLVPGATDRSYGVHVGRLAGLPEELLADADRLLQRLESEGIDTAPSRGRRKPVRYTQAILLGDDAAPRRVVDDLRQLDVDGLSADALRERLKELRRIASAPPEAAE